MMKLLSLLLAATLFSCQKEIETQDEFLMRTDRVTQSQRFLDGEKLAVSVDFVVNPEPVTAFIHRYDSINSQPVLVESDTFRIPAGYGQWSRYLRPTGFPYRGNLQVKIMRDTTGLVTYERWVTLTNASGLIINLDTTAQAVPGHAGTSHIMDVVPKHYQ